VGGAIETVVNKKGGSGRYSRIKAGRIERVETCRGTSQTREKPGGVAVLAAKPPKGGASINGDNQ